MYAIDEWRENDEYDVTFHDRDLQLWHFKRSKSRVASMKASEHVPIMTMARRYLSIHLARDTIVADMASHTS